MWKLQLWMLIWMLKWFEYWLTIKYIKEIWDLITFNLAQKRSQCETQIRKNAEENSVMFGEGKFKFCMYEQIFSTIKFSELSLWKTFKNVFPQNRKLKNNSFTGFVIKPFLIATISFDVCFEKFYRLFSWKKQHFS